MRCSLGLKEAMSITMMGRITAADLSESYRDKGLQTTPAE